MAKTMSWKGVAIALAERLSYNNDACPEHSAREAEVHRDECPFCADTYAYSMFVKKINQ